MTAEGPIDRGRNYNYYVWNMGSQTAPLGEFEQVVILAVMRLKDNAYGVTIRAEIAARTDRRPTAGALHTTLDRLEDKGLLTSRFGDPTPRRGGRAKRYFSVTAPGVAAIARAQRSYRRLLTGLRLPEVVHG
jgi:DNA-binding PadR family transcriptional regulator